jgi:S1-C subfamily serine protease
VRQIVEILGYIKHITMKQFILVLSILYIFSYNINSQVYNNPPCKSKTESDLLIKRIDRNTNNTIIDFEYTRSSSGIYILLYSPNTDGALYIKTSVGIYKLIQTIGIASKDRITFAAPYKTIKFTAIFQPIPKNIESFDIIEGKTGSWHFYGVQLKNNESTSSEYKTIQSEANMRQSGNAVSDVICIIPAGTQVKTFSLSLGYYKVEYNGKVGYINQIYFKNDNSETNDNQSFSNNTTQPSDIKVENCNEIINVPASSKPSFQSMLAGVKYVVVYKFPTINGQIPSYMALNDYLKGMGFENIEYYEKNYEQPSNLCDEIFIDLSYDYDLEKFYNINMTFVNLPTGYTWEFSSNKIVWSREYEETKYNFGQVLREMYGYKKNDFNSNNRIELAKKQTCWSESKFKSQILSKGCDKLEGIYENSANSSQESKYRVGVKKINGTYYLIYFSGAHNVGNWSEGEIKATLETTATPLFFKAKWIMSDKSENSDYYVSFESGLMNVFDSQSEKSLYIKLFPSISDNVNTPSDIAGSGTGYAITSNGYIVTNHHVTDGASSIKVRGVNGDFSKTYSAKVIIEDKNNDLSIIKINDPNFTSLGTIPYVIANRASDVGSSVFVLGYPLITTMGDEIKLTNGIISAKSGFQGDVSLYQITAPVQPGNSGGPLFDSQGNIIGIINAKHLSAENVTYAIKASYLLNLINTLDYPLNLQKVSSLYGKPLTQQVLIIKKFIYIIEVN